MHRIRPRGGVGVVRVLVEARMINPVERFIALLAAFSPSLSWGDYGLCVGYHKKSSRR